MKVFISREKTSLGFLIAEILNGARASYPPQGVREDCIVAVTGRPGGVSGYPRAWYRSVS